MNTVSIPIICETSYCRNNGAEVNRISDYPADCVDLFFENYDGREPEDRCPLCGKAGIALEPEMD